jgi:hypothetical protein
VSGLPERIPQQPIKVLAENFSVVASAFELDLRSQKQVFRQAEAAASGLAEGSNLHCLFMFFLAAAYQRGAKVYDSLSAPSMMSDAAIGAMNLVNVPIPFFALDRDGEQVSSKTSFIELIRRYAALSGRTADEVIRANGRHSSDYPESITQRVASEFQNRRYARSDKTSLASYFQLVRAGGQVVSRKQA